MAEMSFDFSSLNSLAADLGAIADEVIPNVVKAVTVSARHVKDEWRDSAKKNNPSHAPAYPFAVDYDLENQDGQISAQIGPNLAKNQGALGILEDAPGGVRSAPQGNARKAMKKVVPDFVEGLQKATGSLS